MQLTLTFKTPEKFWAGNRYRWVLKGSVTASGEDADPNVFVYRTGVAGTVIPKDLFQNPASLAQMADLPIGPEGVHGENGVEYSYYRTNEFEFVHTHLGEIHRVMNAIRNDLEELVRDLAAARDLTTETVFTITEQGSEPQ